MNRRTPLTLLFGALITVLTASLSLECQGSCAPSLKMSDKECSIWEKQVLPKNIPEATDNTFADREDAAVLGMKIFYDNRFSKAGSGVACVSCHDPEHGFSETKARSHTINEALRNAPDLINSVWYRERHFWDGKVNNLWSAPLFTFEQPDEMGSTRLRVAHTLEKIYASRYKKIFGDWPDLTNLKRFPLEGKPGMPEYDMMSTEDKATVDRIYVNVGKSLEAYIRKLAAGPSPFDAYMGGAATSLSAGARKGMDVFVKFECMACHSGPAFTDEKFHNLMFPELEGRPDLGREAGIKFFSSWAFKSSKGREDDLLSSNDRKAFRTPSLRNVALTSPYGHNGSFSTLDEVISGHSKAIPEIRSLTAQEKSDLVEFLRALTGRQPNRPWNYWPGG